MAVAEIRPSQVRAITNENYISSQDLALGGNLTHGLAKPLIDNNYYRRYGVQYMTGFVEMIGQKRDVNRAEYFHYEQDFIRSTIRVEAQAGGAVDAAVTLTVVAGDTFDIVSGSPYVSTTSQTTSPPRVQDVVRIPDGTFFGVEALVTAVTSNTFTVVPNVSGEAIPATSLNDEVINTGNAHGEGTGSPASRNTRMIEYSNNTQIFKGFHSVTGTARESITWLDDLEGPNGERGSAWYLEGMFDEYINYLNDRELQILTGRQITNTVLANTAGQEENKKTRGIIPDIQDNGIVETYTIGQLALTDIKSLTRNLDKYKGAPEYMLHCGHDINEEIDDFLREGDGGTGLSALNGLKNGGVLYNVFDGDEEQFLKFSFKGFEYGGYTFYKRKLDILSSVEALGADGFKYRNLAIGIPMGETVVYQRNNPNTSAKVPTMMINQLQPYREWKTGGDAPIPTDNVNRLEMNMLEECGIEIAGLNRYFLLVGTDA